VQENCQKPAGSAQNFRHTRLI